jgi:hypothetical protein
MPRTLLRFRPSSKSSGTKLRYADLPFGNFLLSLTWQILGARRGVAARRAALDGLEADDASDR